MRNDVDGDESAGGETGATAANSPAFPNNFTHLDRREKATVVKEAMAGIPTSTAAT